MDCKIKRVGALKGGSRVDCKTKCKIKRVLALRRGWRVDSKKKVQN